MAVVYRYTIIYFTLIIHESMFISIDRDLCLETAARFIDDQDKCYFDLSTALAILQDVTTCPKKCNFRIDNLESNTYSLRSIYLTMGNKENKFYPCSGTYYSRNLYINCSLWNAMEYRNWYYPYTCFLNNAKCVRIYSNCFCHCLPGYILVDDKCLKKIVNIGGLCEFNWQCKGTNFANVCDHEFCTCSRGYIQIDRTCYQGNRELEDSCELSEQCIQPFSECFQGKCKCVNGYSAFDAYSCLKDTVPVGGFCSLHKQCTGSNYSGICENGRCTCTEGFTPINLTCEKRNLELNDSCELTEQCLQPFSECFHGKCKCINGYSAFDKERCLKGSVPVGGFCNLSEQCTGSRNSGICEHGRCSCTEGFTSINLACEKHLPNSFGGTNSQQQDTNTGATLGAFLGGLLLGVIVTAVVTTLMYKRLKSQTRKREEPDVVFADNRGYGGAEVVDSGAQILYANDKKQKVANVFPYSSSKETSEYKVSGKKENERTDDVYNHLHEQTEHDDDTYDHACAAPDYSVDLPEYCNIRNVASAQLTLQSIDGGDYSTL